MGSYSNFGLCMGLTTRISNSNYNHLHSRTLAVPAAHPVLVDLPALVAVPM